MNINQALATVLQPQSLTRAQMRAVMLQIMTGKTTDAQMAGFLIALRCKGESIEELTAAAEVMRELAIPVNIQGEHVIDTCGTGGDGANTFNISTTCAFVVAAAGAKVAKHGNRSVSSASGSADVLEAAGINLNLTAIQVEACVEAIGVGFLFAPKHHSAMKHAIGVRKEMAVRTMFNVLGPLSNPAEAKNQLIGVFAANLTATLARVLKNLGSEHVLIVHADDGLDEISIATETSIAELHQGLIQQYKIKPEDFGIQRSSLASLAVHDAKSSLECLLSVLDNQAGAAKDIVVLNAGAAIYTANLTTSLAAGVELAQTVIANGAAKAKFTALREFSNKVD